MVANPLAFNAIPDRRKGNGSRSCAFKLGGAGGAGAAEAQRNGERVCSRRERWQRRYPWDEAPHVEERWKEVKSRRVGIRIPARLNSFGGGGNVRRRQEGRWEAGRACAMRQGGRCPITVTTPCVGGFSASTAAWRMPDGDEYCTGTMGAVGVWDCWLRLHFQARKLVGVWSTSCTNSLPSERAAKNLPKELFSMQGQCDDGAYGDGHVLDCATTLIPARVGSGCI